VRGRARENDREKEQWRDGGKEEEREEKEKERREVREDRREKREERTKGEERERVKDNVCG